MLLVVSCSRVLLPRLVPGEGLLDLALYEGNLRSLLLLGSDRNRPGCWRDRGNNNVEEGTEQAYGTGSITLRVLRAQRASSVW